MPPTAKETHPSEAIAAHLSCPSSYPDRPQRVERLETHISWVFLTDQFAFKLKKPVRFEFLDFRSLESRKEACENELRLNRRLAPEVYLDLLPIVRRPSGWQLGGPGLPVDWVVKMRRLPAELALDQQLQHGGVHESDVQQLAQQLDRFYAGLSPVSCPPDEYRASIREHVVANCDALGGAKLFRPDRRSVRRICQAQLTWLTLHPDQLERRIAAGRIVEGHGDLRPEHIYLTRPPVVIDCIEFNASFRTLDILDELAFLAMECELLGAAWIADRIRERYQESSGDQPGPQLWSFYKSYRAMVRAKVCSLRAEQLTEPESHAARAQAHRYLTLAVREAQGLGGPWLVVVRGLSGTGKSTLAKQLAEQLGMQLLQTDDLRQQLLGGSSARSTYGSADYSWEKRFQVYAAMLQQADQLLSQGCSVILDGTFLRQSSRREARALADRHRAHWLLTTCHCASEVVAQRLARRHSDGASNSDADWQIHQHQRAEEEPEEDGPQSLHLDTAQPPSQSVAAVVEAMRRTATACGN